ncbi:DUF1559 domain-containing protein [Bremerella sp. JC770]|uniref:DUF1559 family PulG-like putative transporter n=1 Tax=Bremerella sp. JC770 TaxID=3232137 RepID=UPI00345AB8D2
MNKLVLTGVVCFVVFLFFVVPFITVRQVKMAADKANCSNSLKMICLALHNYHDFYFKLPPSMMNEHSWRIRIDPFMHASPYYEAYRFEEPWNSEWNKTLEFRYLPGMKTFDEEELEEIDLFELDPNAESLAHGRWQCPLESNRKSTLTTYLMPVGANAFGLPERGRSFDEITDSLSTTIAVAEYAGHDIQWLEPKDFDVETMSFRINDPNPEKMSISSHHPGGPLVGMADGSVRQLSPDLPPEVVQAMITINGGEKIVEDANAPGGYRLED